MAEILHHLYTLPEFFQQYHQYLSFGKNEIGGVIFLKTAVPLFRVVDLEVKCHDCHRRARVILVALMGAALDAASASGAFQSCMARGIAAGGNSLGALLSTEDIPPATTKMKAQNMLKSWILL